MSDRTAVVVLGARSGTSALAGTLGLIGCTLPKNLMSSDWANLKGYFEPKDVADLHDELLASVGSEWSDWRIFPSLWFDSAAAVHYRRKLAAMFDENFGGAMLVVLKEPRMCRLLPLWVRIFRDLAVTPAFCFIDRNPFEVAASLQVRDGSSLTQGLLYYLRNHFESEYATRGHPRAFIAYDNLLVNWRGTIASVGEKLGIDFPDAERRREQVDGFLDRTLRHQVGNAISGSATTLGPMADSVHAIFGQLAGGGSEMDGRAHLDRLRLAFNESMEVDSPILRDNAIGAAALITMHTSNFGKDTLAGGLATLNFAFEAV